MARTSGDEADRGRPSGVHPRRHPPLPPSAPPPPADGASALTRTAREAAQLVSLPVTIAQQAVPRPSSLAYYAGLGVMAALGVLEWPVAGVIAIGYAVASGCRRGPGGCRGAGPPRGVPGIRLAIAGRAHPTVATVPRGRGSSPNG